METPAGLKGILVEQIMKAVRDSYPDVPVSTRNWLYEKVLNILEKNGIGKEA